VVVKVASKKALRRRTSGATLMGVAIALVAAVGVLTAVAVPSYQRLRAWERVDQAQRDITMLAAALNIYKEQARSMPRSLAEAGLGAPLDPWGQPYEYLNLADPQAGRAARKYPSQALINADFDLYSKGPDGQSAPPVNDPVSRDDIVRAKNGAFVGGAADLHI
jgi:general secretion pathway protein G